MGRRSDVSSKRTAANVFIGATPHRCVREIIRVRIDMSSPRATRGFREGLELAAGDQVIVTSTDVTISKNERFP